MSAKRQNTSSPKRKPSSPKRKPASRSSKPKPRKTSVRTASARTAARSRPRRRWWLIGLAIVAVLLVGLWFGTANLRTKQAISFDQKSQTALERDDLGAAYQQERFAYALVPRNTRALTLGSLAYLREDYPAAVRYFRSAAGGGDEAGIRNRALIGVAAAAARADDRTDFDRAVKQLGQPDSAGLRLALADAAIDAGDLERGAEILADDRPETVEFGFAKALAQSATDPAGAAKTLRGTSSRGVKLAFDDPAYQRFVEQLIAVPEDGRRELASDIARMSQESAEVSRTVTLAEALYGFGDYRAAERLARDAVQNKPDYRDGWNALAAAQLAVREYHDAERSLKISTDLDSGYGYTWYLRSRLAEATDKQSQAEEYARRAELLGYEKP